MFHYHKSKGIDFGFAMYVLIHHRSFDRFEGSDSFVNHQRILDLIGDMHEQMDQDHLQILSKLVKKYHMYGYVVGIACEYPTYDLDQIIATIEDLDGQSFYHKYLYYVLHLNQHDEDRVKDKILEINGNNLSKTAPAYTSVQYIKRHGDRMRQELVEFLTYFKDIYQSVCLELDAFSQAAMTIYKSHFTDIESFVKQMPLIEASILGHVEEVNVYVTSMIDTGMFVYVFDNKTDLIIGSSLTHMLTKAFQEEQRLMIYKYLGDPTKVRILKLIHEKTLCAKDIVEALGMSKSNISHHLSQLSAANMIYLADKTGKKTYYKVNVSTLELVFQETLQAFQ